MTEELVIHIAKNMLVTTLVVSLPMLIASLFVGLAVSIFQAVTQINEMTLTFIPKVLALIVTLILFMPWMMNTILSYMQEMFHLMSTLSQ